MGSYALSPPSPSTSLPTRKSIHVLVTGFGVSHLPPPGHPPPSSPTTHPLSFPSSPHAPVPHSHSPFLQPSSHPPTYAPLTPPFPSQPFHTIRLNPSHLIALALPPTLTTENYDIHIHAHPKPIEVSYHYVREVVPLLLFPPPSPGEKEWTQTLEPEESWGQRAFEERFLGAAPVLRGPSLNTATTGYTEGKGGKEKALYDVVLFMGVAPNRACYSLETRARRDEFAAVDADGHHVGKHAFPKEQGVPRVLRTGVDAEEVLVRWREGCAVSVFFFVFFFALAAILLSFFFPSSFPFPHVLLSPAEHLFLLNRFALLLSNHRRLYSSNRTFPPLSNPHRPSPSPTMQATISASSSTIPGCGSIISASQRRASMGIQARKDQFCFCMCRKGIRRGILTGEHWWRRS